MIPLGTMTMAFFFAVYAYQTKGRGAVYRVLIPIMMFVSFSFVYQASPGLPELSVYTVTCLVLAGAVWYVDRPVIRLQVTDVLVVLFVLGATLVTSISSGTKPALAFFYTSVVGVLAPYLLFRTAIRREELPRFLAAFTLCVAVVALVAPLEAFLLIRITDPMQALWPTYASAHDFFRGGFNRVAAAFGHPIHAGMMFTFGALFCWFLLLSGRFARPLRWIAFMVLMGLALYLTGSRSAYVFSVPMIAMVYFHFSRKKVAYGLSLLIVLVTTLTVVLPIYEAYAGARDLSNADETQTSAAYRKLLGENYLNVVLAKPMTGWGVSLPVINGQGSIDNHYLLAAMIYGIPVSVLFWSIGLWSILVGLFHYFFRPGKPMDKGLIWLCVTGLVFIGVCASIVWLTAQAMQMYFLLAALIISLTEAEAPPRVGASLRWL